LVSNGVRARQGTFSIPKDDFEYVESLAYKSDRMLLDLRKGCRGEAPTAPQLWKLYFADRRLKVQFRSGKDFIRYAETEFAKGNRGWTKGAVSSQINNLQVTK
jgi:hypothetical protein